MLIRWKEELEIGNEMIDTRHRMLVLLLRKLDIAVKSNLTHKAIMGVMPEIRRLTEFHFLSEENLMAELRYPNLLDHEKSTPNCSASSTSSSPRSTANRNSRKTSSP